MRYSLVLASVFVAGVIGKPIADPAIDYDVKIVKVTKTVIVSGDATPEPELFLDSAPKPGMFIPEPAPIPWVIESEPVPLPEITEPESDSDSTEDTSEAPQDGGSSVSGSPDGDFQERVLYHHDIHRVNHSASGIAWSDTLASIAQETAGRCVYGHDT